MGCGKLYFCCDRATWQRHDSSKLSSCIAAVRPWRFHPVITMRATTLLMPRISTIRQRSAIHVGSRWKYSTEDKLEIQTIHELNTTQKKQTTQKTAIQNYPGSVASYDNRPRNEVGSDNRILSLSLIYKCSLLRTTSITIIKIKRPSIDGISPTKASYHQHPRVGWPLVVDNQHDKYCRSWPNSYACKKSWGFGATPHPPEVGWMMRIDGPALMSQRVKFCDSSSFKCFCMEIGYFKKLVSGVPCPFGWGRTPKFLVWSW